MKHELLAKITFQPYENLCVLVINIFRAMDQIAACNADVGKATENYRLTLQFSTAAKCSLVSLSLLFLFATATQQLLLHLSWCGFFGGLQSLWSLR